jgi:aminodeoxychorismate lyase
MLIFLNGRFVPEGQAVVSVFDRGFLYGDGLFETLRVFNGKPFRWAQHMERLRRGAGFLKIRLPFRPEAWRGFAEELIVRNQMPDALLRLTLSRGVGRRGYSPRGAELPTLVMSLHPTPGALDSDLAGSAGSESGAPRRWKLTTGSFRLPAGDPLAAFKTCNKLPQILARAEAEAAGADEALLLNTDGFVVEAASGNLFWLDGETVCTPPPAGGILPGVTRAVVLELCRAQEVSVREANVGPEELTRQQAVFVSLSSAGIVEAESLNGRLLQHSPLTEKLRRAYAALVRAETD